MSPHVSSYIITAARAGPSAKPTNSDSVNPAGIVFETYPFQESCLLIWDLYKSSNVRVSFVGEHRFLTQEYKKASGKVANVQKEVVKPHIHIIARCRSCDVE